jgi:hypothetical protein
MEEVVDVPVKGTVFSLAEYYASTELVKTFPKETALLQQFMI